MCSCWSSKVTKIGIRSNVVSIVDIRRGLLGVYSQSPVKTVDWLMETSCVNLDTCGDICVALNGCRRSGLKVNSKLSVSAKINVLATTDMSLPLQQYLYLKNNDTGEHHYCCKHSCKRLLKVAYQIPSFPIERTPHIAPLKHTNGF